MTGGLLMYKRMKKFLSFMISVFMILAYMPTKIHALFDYSICIHGSEISGSAPYAGNESYGWEWRTDSNAKTATLDINNLTVALASGSTGDKANGINIKVPNDIDVTIKVSGENSIKSYAAALGSCGINVEAKSLTIDCQGSGKLYTWGYDYGIHAHCPLIIKNGGSGGEVKAESHARSYYDGYKAILCSSGNSITFDSSMGIYDPLGGSTNGTTILNSDGSEATSATIKALPKYTAKFVNHDGSQLQSSQLTRGQTPTYNGGTPTKPQDTEHTYSFKGWSPSLGPIGEDTTYTAQFNTAARKYTIKFVNFNGDVLESKEVDYGSTPTYTGATPTHPPNDQYTYTFSGWYPALAPVSGDATYAATYTTTTNEYTVTFVNYDATQLEQKQVPYGEAPTYTGQAPTKPEDAQYTYTFIGWEPEIVPGTTTVEHNITYVAKYRQDLRKYTITFKNYDDTELESKQVEYGSTPEYTGQTPTKPSIEGHEYAFNGWSPTIQEVTGDATYRATFSDTTLSYTVRFLNDDNSVLKESQVLYGQTPVPPEETPTKPATVQYTYNFNGWNREITPVTGNTTYVATYTSTLNSYTVRFVDGNGQDLQVGLWEYGTTPTYNGLPPTKDSDDEHSYVWTGGWDKEIIPVVGNTTYTATFTDTKNSYTIRFVNENGDELQNSTLQYGLTPVYNGPTPTKASTDQYAYRFKGWTPEIDTVKGEATYTATFDEISLYTVRFLNEDGTELQSSKVAAGETPVYSGTTPTKAKTKEYIYTFAGWTPEIVPVTADTVYTATYNTETNTEHSETNVDPDNPEEITNDDEEPVEEPDNWDTPEDTPEEENLDTAETPAEEPETMEASDTPSTQGSSESAENSETSYAPSTGDESQFLLWIMLAAVSFGWLSFSAVASKKRILSLLNAIDNSGK